MSEDFLKLIFSLLTASAGVIGTILTYFKVKSHRDKLAAIRENFDKVILSLKSQNEIERAAGAVLLRRFFDPTTEGGTVVFFRIRKSIAKYQNRRATESPRKTPYAAEAIGVIASILRMSGNGTFQKLLADGLAYAPTLRGVDLQRTNLRNAYLGSRVRVRGSWNENVRVDLSDADLFRADLSDTSLKDAIAERTVFYQARMHNTVLAGAKLAFSDFREADLRGADFRRADLSGAKFSRAILEGANFEQAENIPPEVAAKIAGHRWTEKGPLQIGPRATTTAVRIFLAKPGCLDFRQKYLVELFSGWIETLGFEIESLDREAYPERGAIEELCRRIERAHGCVVFGFGELELKDAPWRQGTPDASVMTGKLSTPWCQIEAGMAAAFGIPILVVPESDVNTGVFWRDLRDELIYTMDVNSGPETNSFVEWSRAARNRSSI